MCSQVRLQAIREPAFPIRAPQLITLLLIYCFYTIGKCVYSDPGSIFIHPNFTFFDLAVISVSRLFGRHSVLDLRSKTNTFSFSLVLYHGLPQSEYVALAEGKSM